MNVNPKVSETLNRIVELFRTGNVPQAISIVTFPKFDVPSNNWSLTNRLIMAISGTSDARGFNQWKEANRYVKKGSKSFSILAPWIATKKKDISFMPEDQRDDREPTPIAKILRGFLAVAVFAVESTEGQALDYQKLELPQLPLLEVARAWNIDVAPVAFQNDWFAYYRPTEDREEIRLATPSEKSFFHELSHAAHRRVIGELRHGQDWRQECVAELSAQTLCHLVGLTPGATLGNSFEYISYYADKAGKDISSACLSVISQVEQVLDLILQTSSEIHPAVAPTVHS